MNTAIYLAFGRQRRHRLRDSGEHRRERRRRARARRSRFARLSRRQHSARDRGDRRQSEHEVRRQARSSIKVTPGTPAAEAGLKSGDVITKLNGEEVKDAADLSLRIGSLKPGGKVELTYNARRRREDRVM